MSLFTAHLLWEWSGGGLDMNRLVHRAGGTQTEARGAPPCFLYLPRDLGTISLPYPSTDPVPSCSLCSQHQSPCAPSM